MGQLWGSPFLLPFPQGAPSCIDCCPILKFFLGFLCGLKNSLFEPDWVDFSLICSPRLPNWHSSKRTGCRFCGGHFTPLNPKKPCHEGDSGRNKQNPFKPWTTTYRARTGTFQSNSPIFTNAGGIPTYTFVIVVLFCFNKRLQRRRQRTRTE